MAKPLVALVGRPNVGKSRLFNRLIGERAAIVEDVPGTTRDRIYGDYDWNGRDVALVDTGGLTTGAAEDIAAMAMAQARVAIEQADVIVMVVDVRDGVIPLDQDIAQILRQSGKAVILAANKADNRQLMEGGMAFYELGLGDPVPVSAERGLGTGDLLDRIDAALPAVTSAAEDVEAVRIAFVGRPNVGKSSLVNTLVGSERTIVAPTPGTTRDAVDTELRFKKQTVVLVDTAGIRRRGRIEPGIEKYSVLRSHRAIDRADVAVLALDATGPPAAQDAHIAGFVEREGKGLVIAVNKWDLVEKGDRTMRFREAELAEAFKFVDYAPVVFVSALTKQRVPHILDLALSVAGERAKRVPTGRLNDVVQRALLDFQPPARQGRRLQFRYATQVAVCPPAFVCFVNDASLVHFSYERFLVNRLRDQFGFMGSPIRLHFRSRTDRHDSPR